MEVKREKRSRKRPKMHEKREKKRMRVHGKLGRKKQANWRPQSEPEKKGKQQWDANRRNPPVSSRTKSSRSIGGRSGWAEPRASPSLPFCSRRILPHVGNVWQNRFLEFSHFCRGANLQETLCNMLANTWQNGIFVLWAYISRDKPPKGSMPHVGQHVAEWLFDPLGLF